MANTAPKRPTPAQLKTARDIAAAIQTMTGYNGGDDCAPANLQSLDQDVTAKRAVETQTRNAADAARDAAVAVEVTLYQRALRVREKVVGQFGSDSDQAAAVGLKKKSERKKRSSKKAVASP